MSRLITLQLALTEALYTDPTVIDRGQEMLLDLWGKEDTPGNRSWVWTGWNGNYRVIANPNITVYVYRATIKQMKQELVNTMTSEEMARYKAWFQQEPQAKASINRTPDDSLAAWGVEHKPTEL